MAQVKDVTFVRGIRDTADDLSADKPLEISSDIRFFDANKNKALNWLMKYGQTKPTPEHVFYHLEDAPHARWVTYAGNSTDGAGADEAAQRTTGHYVVSGQGVRITTGSVIYWPRTDELMRLDAAMTTDTTGAVSRNEGRGNASTSLIKNGDHGLLMESQFSQGYTPGLGMTGGRVQKTFYTQIIDYPVEVTGTENAEKARGGNIFQRELAKTIAAAKHRMEATLLYGGATTDASTYSYQLTGTEGLKNVISTHTYSASSISRMDLWDILLEWKSTWGGDGGAIACSSWFKAMVTNWAMGMTNYAQTTKVDGMDIQSVMTPAGKFDLIDIHQLGEDPYLLGDVFGLPPDHVHYRPLVGYENRDIRYDPLDKKGSTGQDVKSGHVWGEYGWEIYREEDFFYLNGLEFAA